MGQVVWTFRIADASVHRDGDYIGRVKERRDTVNGISFSHYEYFDKDGGLLGKGEVKTFKQALAALKQNHSKGEKPLADVIDYSLVTRHDVHIEKVLDAAKEECETVVICGLDGNGDLYFSSSHANSAEILLLLERCKAELLRQFESQNDG